MPEIVPAPIRTEGDSVPAPAPAPARVSGTGYLECDFCHCKLTKTGEVYQVSTEAREFRDEKEKHIKAIGKLDEQIAALQASINEKERKIAELSSSPGKSLSRMKIAG